MHAVEASLRRARRSCGTRRRAGFAAAGATAFGPPVKVTPAGGHGYGKDNRERASFTALGYNFLRNAIGWTQDRGREE